MSSEKKWVEGNIIIRQTWTLSATACIAVVAATSGLPFGPAIGLALMALPATQLACGIAGDYKARNDTNCKVAEKLMQVALFTDSILNSIPSKPFAGMSVFNLQNMARLRRAQGRAEEAESFNRQTLRLLETHVRDSVMLTLACKDLALSLIEQSRAVEAEELARHALEVMPKNASPLGSYFAFSTLAQALVMQQRNEEALSTIQQAEQLAGESKFATDSRQDRKQLYEIYRHSIALTKVSALVNLAKTTEVADFRKQILGWQLEGVDTYDDITMVHSNLGFQLMEAGDLDGAQELLTRARTRLDNDDTSDKTRAFVLGNLGDLYRRRGRLDDAEKNSLEALRLFELAEGDTGSNISWCALDLGKIYRDKGDKDKARVFFTRSLSVLTNEDPVNMKKVAEAQSELEKLG